ncbi:peroxidase [Paucibacter sp. APW11]|uniref:Peroxidase n=1 Tax=Roseateles aquae TaxID=3077235 RepID=A0ABU3PAF5_9BURK|nr:peroxidase [Paucibacter sp. APW11]MDT8999571.1 peroxidase [Paucibacter sp. APW11]
MTQQLDLPDIQGNVIRPYGRFGYPVGRYVFYNIKDSTLGRAFVAALTARVTTSVDWGPGPDQRPQPDWTLNLAFSYQGLKNLDLPVASLIGFSPEFVQGMKDRHDILGDNGPSAPEHWDPIWRENREIRERDVHIFVQINARTPALREAGYQWLQARVAQYAEGVSLLSGHRADEGALIDYQDVEIIFENGKPTSKEHFGYTDGIGDPAFEGMPNAPDYVLGRGKQMADGSWAPLATGEFLLGHIDEAQEYPPAPDPQLLSRNGSYMVYRKLHENVASFEAYLDQHAEAYARSCGQHGASAAERRELLAAKFVGRWRDNGAPLVKAHDFAAKKVFDAQLAAANDAEQDKLLSNWTYDEDMSGGKCPFSSHIRRINPRASLQMIRDPGDKPGSLKVSTDAFDTPGALSNRRRVLRRGLPYGRVKDRSRNDGNHGIVIMMLNADINRQFEFVQQQWINYGNDFKAGNDKEILLGNHSVDERYPSKAVLQVEPDSEHAPYFLSKIPRLVETRGGEYFFVPSMTALRMIAKGLIDPT